ncbi:transcriptional regulator [Egicoccus halophilus]|uniref:HTH arsR-type domain-containing protein n=1 Tax=Egicoccus halophilus TaxID=1670830 RepID=A0A8J3A9V0_9ACTN|nr:transcriptional regulator [Egicoccus halophilus]GGI08094.1 hypothetical protein GCM10011354_27380 [Egicoccus halophilus]
MPELDLVIHAPKRLRIMAVLGAFESVTFAVLQQRLGLTAPDLSKQLRALQDAGYVKSRKTGRGPGSETWVAMTRAGTKAYDAHVAALRALLDGGDTAPSGCVSRFLGWVPPRGYVTKHVAGRGAGRRRPARTALTPAHAPSVVPRG